MKGRTIRQVFIKMMIFAKKASPYVLAGLSAAGTVAVTVEAVKEIKKNTPETIYLNENDEVVSGAFPDEDISQEEADELPIFKGTKFEIVKDKAVNAIKLYWKPIIFGTESIACLFGSVFIFSKRQKQLIVATYQMQQLLQRYTQAATATAGVGGTALLSKLEPENRPEETPFDIEDDGKIQFWDPVFKYWFRASMENFLDAAYGTSTEFSKNGAVPISYFYKRMGVPVPIDDDENGYFGWGWWIDDDLEWCDFYGDDAGYLGISCSEVKTIDDDLEYREICYYQAPMFNANGRMLDGDGNDFYDLKWLYN